MSPLSRDLTTEDTKDTEANSFKEKALVIVVSFVVLHFFLRL